MGQEADLIGLQEQQTAALGAVTSGCSADTVDVVLGVIRRVELDNKVHSRDIQASSSNVSADKNAVFGIAELEESVGPLLLFEIAVEFENREINVVEEFGMVFDTVATRAEDDDLLFRHLLEKREEQEKSLVRFADNIALFKTGDPLEIPVDAGGTIIPVASRAAIFGSVATAAGLRDLTTIVTEAAAAITDPDPAVRAAAVPASIDAINAAAAHVAGARGYLGVTANRIEDLKERHTQSGMQLSEQRGGLEATDLVEAIARLHSKQLGLQAAQAVFTRVNQGTLFDLLR
ncbi:MAG: hypothetical protein M1823_006666 [Watsoniomyces obsoletus]|nr:MAG: hypothetical protein M1823_006666 [Watsoniomyces obsoletus]